MPVEKKPADPKNEAPSAATPSKTPAADALCSNAPDKEKCKEFVEARLGEASNNITPSSD